MIKRPVNPERELEQTLALMAATAPPAKAGVAWRELMTWMAFEAMNEGTQRIVPAIFRNLQTEIDVPERDRLKGVYRNAWVRNQQLLFGVEPVLVSLTSRGVDYRVTKGMAVLQLVEAVGSRVMSDVDIVVRSRDIDLVRRVMSEHGYRSSDGLVCVHQTPSTHREALNFNRGNERIDVHVVPYREPTGLFTAMLETPAVHARSSTLLLAEPSLVMLNAMLHGSRADSRTDFIQSLIDVHMLNSIVSLAEVAQLSEELDLAEIVNQFLTEAEKAGIESAVVRRPKSRAMKTGNDKRLRGVRKMRERGLNQWQLWSARSIRLPRASMRNCVEFRHAVSYRIWLQMGKSANLERRILRRKGGFLVSPVDVLPEVQSCQPFAAQGVSWLSVSSVAKIAVDWRFGFRNDDGDVDVILEFEHAAFDDSDAFLFLNGTFVTKIVGGDCESRTVYLRKVPARAEVSIRPIGAACEDCFPDLTDVRVTTKVVRVNA